MISGNTTAPGALVLVLAGYFGWFARFFEFVPGAVVFPLIIYVGLRTIAHSYEATAPRDYAALAFAAWMARQTRSGVSGMSICLIP